MRARTRARTHAHAHTNTRTHAHARTHLSCVHQNTCSVVVVRKRGHVIAHTYAQLRIQTGEERVARAVDDHLHRFPGPPGSTRSGHLTLTSGVDGRNPGPGQNSRLRTPPLWTAAGIPMRSRTGVATSAPEVGRAPQLDGGKALGKLGEVGGCQFVQDCPHLECAAPPGASGILAHFQTQISRGQRTHLAQGVVALGPPLAAPCLHTAPARPNHGCPGDHREAAVLENTDLRVLLCFIIGYRGFHDL